MKKNLLIAAIAAQVSVAAVAESKIEQMIVTGTRTSVSLDQSIYSVDLIDRAQIERIQAVDLYSLLDRLPGVSFTRNGGHGASTSLLLRGNQSDHTLFLIDGVRIGSATLGSANLADLNTAMIERIEIVRGPKSSLYGSDAIAGVVNIITRKSDKPRELIVEAGIGNNKTREVSVLGGLNGETYGLTVNTRFFDTEGVDNTESKAGFNGDKDANENRSVAVNFNKQLTDQANLKVIYNRADTETEYDANCGDAITFAPVACQIYSDSLVSSLSAAVNIAATDWWEMQFQMGTTKDESEQKARNIDLLTTYNGGVFSTKKSEATAISNFRPSDAVTLTVGVDYILDEVEGTTNYAEDGRTNKAGFVQIQSDLGALDLAASGRYDDNQQFGSQDTYSAGAGLDIGSNLRFTLSYGEGFKAPTFNDLYFPFFGDPTFKPETSKSYEIGAEFKTDGFKTDLYVYRNTIENLIQYNPAIFASDQTAKAEIEGVEFSASTKIQGLDVYFSADYADPINKGNDQLLRRRSRYSANLDVDYSFGQFAAGFSARTEGERYDNAANTVKLDGYQTFDLRAQYQLTETLKVKAKVNNITDEEYATAVDFSLGEYQAIGREYFVSVEWSPNL